MFSLLRGLVAMAAVLLLASACADDGGDAGDAVEVVPESTTTTTSTVAPSSTTTAAADAVPGSTARVTIGPAVYELDAVCASGGAGEIEASLRGVDVNGLPVSGYVRGYLSDPYVSLQVGEGDDAVLFEPRLEGVIPIEFNDDGMLLTEVDFVSELDLETGAFVPAGLGAAEVSCVTYERSLPDEVALADTDS